MDRHYQDVMRHDARLQAVERDAANHPRDGMQTSPRTLVKTYTVTSYPVTAQAYYATHPVTVGGVEAEGMPVSLTDGSTTIYVGNLGTGVPPSGSYLVASHVPNRWITRYD